MVDRGLEEERTVSCNSVNPVFHSGIPVFPTVSDFVVSLSQHDRTTLLLCLHKRQGLSPLDSRPLSSPPSLRSPVVFDSETRSGPFTDRNSTGP